MARGYNAGENSNFRSQQQKLAEEKAANYNQSDDKELYPPGGSDEPSSTERSAREQRDDNRVPGGPEDQAEEAAYDARMSGGGDDDDGSYRDNRSSVQIERDNKVAFERRARTEVALNKAGIKLPSWRASEGDEFKPNISRQGTPEEEKELGISVGKMPKGESVVSDLRKYLKENGEAINEGVQRQMEDNMTWHVDQGIQQYNSDDVDDETNISVNGRNYTLFHTAIGDATRETQAEHDFVEMSLGNTTVSYQGPTWYIENKEVKQSLGKLSRATKEMVKSIKGENPPDKAAVKEYKSAVKAVDEAFSKGSKGQPKDLVEEAKSLLKQDIARSANF
jgi:hypothetical protein